MKLLTFIFGAALLLGGFTAFETVAQTNDDLAFNGRNLNGRNLNGRNLNGRNLNGRALNGVVSENAMSDTSAPRVVVLKDGTRIELK